MGNISTNYVLLFAGIHDIGRYHMTSCMHRYLEKSNKKFAKSIDVKFVGTPLGGLLGNRLLLLFLKKMHVTIGLGRLVVGSNYLVRILS